MTSISTTETESVPIFDIIKTDASTVEGTIIDLYRLRAQNAVKAIQEASVRNGLSNMTMEEINAEIAAARAERRSRQA